MEGRADKCRGAFCDGCDRSGLVVKLRDPLREPPPDGGLWSSRKVANWMAEELGLALVAPQGRPQRHKGELCT